MWPQVKNGLILSAGASGGTPSAAGRALSGSISEVI